MIVLSFRNKRDKEKMLDKAREMEMFSRELVDCLEEARHGEHEEYDEDDYDYSERRGRMMRRGRYGYGK
jgi:hypothetical protein